MPADTTCKAIGYIIRDGQMLRRENLPRAERQRLATCWHREAMERAGYTAVTYAQERRNPAAPCKEDTSS